MMFCPGCGYEFREGLRRCPDCDVDLVADLEEVDRARSGRLRGGKTVSVFASQRPQAEMLADMLDEEGIPSVTRAVDGSSPGVELHVLEQDAETHQRLIQDLIAELGTQSPGE
jgi:hypothetical protein